MLLILISIGGTVSVVGAASHVTPGDIKTNSQKGELLVCRMQILTRISLCGLLLSKYNQT